MSAENLPALNTPAVKSGTPTDDAIKALALAVGKNTVAYVEVMYPEAFAATSSTFRVSLRNHIYNDIMAVTKLHTEAEIREWIAANEAHHKKWLALWRKVRKEK